MKKIIATMLGLVSVITAYSQGTVTFANVGAGLNSPVVMNDGTTKISGTTWMIELFGALNSSSSFSLLSTDNTATTALIAPGYFNGGAVSFANTTPGGPAAFQVFIWNTVDGATLAAAQASGLGNAWGESGILSLASTGNPTTTPAGTPSALIGLVNGTPNTPNGNFIELDTIVPEPATIALLGLGGASLLAFRRRKA